MSLKFDRFKIEWIRLGDIEPHPLVQRAFVKKHGEEIAANFDPDQFQPLLVTPKPRAAGKFLVFGGQHRRYGAAQALGEDQRVPCHIFEDAPIDKLAAICRGIDQNVLGWKTLDKWHIRLLAREDVPLKVEATLKRNGLRVDKTRGPGVVQAVAACEAVYLKSGNESVLERTLVVLKTAYGDDPDAFDKALILGVGHLTQLFDGQLDADDLAHKLSKYSGPARMVGQARDRAKTDGMSVHRAMAERVLRVYNSGRRAGRLVL